MLTIAVGLRWWKRVALTPSLVSDVAAGRLHVRREKSHLTEWAETAEKMTGVSDSMDGDPFVKGQPAKYQTA